MSLNEPSFFIVTCCQFQSSQCFTHLVDAISSIPKSSIGKESRPFQLLETFEIRHFPVYKVGQHAVPLHGTSNNFRD